MLMIGHFLERETKLLGISKRREKVYEFKRTAYFSRQLFCDKPLTTRSLCRIALFTTQERLVTSTCVHLLTDGCLPVVTAW